MVKKYSNLVSNIIREKKEIAQEKFAQAENVLFHKYNLKRPPYVREGISVTQEEVDLVKKIRTRLVQLNPEDIPTKSKIYRAGIQLLNEMSTDEVSKIIIDLE